MKLMRIFGFIKSEKKFETEINQLQGFVINEKQNSKEIEFENWITFENLIELLKILRKHNVAFALYDSLYPSPSDPGAYLYYSQEKNDTESAWSMTLGNHGWTGGIYTIEEKIIATQILNLYKQKQINSIRIDNVNFFSHYDKENIDYNRNQNALIYGIHSNISTINPDYLIFGVFSSDNYSPYNIYKLTSNKLFIDKSGTWHSQRHTRKGYIFEGEELSNEKFKVTKELLKTIPIQLLTEKWKGFYTTGNKNEDQLILEFKTPEFHRTISIDSYEIETNKLPIEIKNYRRTIENIIRKLNE